ncbi:MAG: hypothetical protein AB7N24_15665 [Dehalococcoidia bacterium]
MNVTWHGESNGTSNLGQSGELVNTLAQTGTPITYVFNGGTIQVGPVSTNTPTNTPVTPTSTNTPIPGTATNTPIPPTATNTPIPGTATNTPTQTNTPVPGTATNTPTQTNTPTGSSTPGSTTTPGGSATATSTATATPTKIPGGPRTFILYLPMVADDGVSGGGQLNRASVDALAAQVLEATVGVLFGR